MPPGLIYVTICTYICICTVLLLLNSQNKFAAGIYLPRPLIIHNLQHNIFESYPAYSILSGDELKHKHVTNYIKTLY